MSRQPSTGLRIADPPTARGRSRKPAPPSAPPKLAPGTHAPGAAGPPRPVTGPEGRPLPTGSVIYGQAGWDYLTSPSYRRVTAWLDPGLRSTNLPDGSASIPGVGWVRMENVHRREVPHIAEAIQPEPIAVRVSRGNAQSSIVRNWGEDDPRPACRLCSTCDVQHYDGTVSPDWIGWRCLVTVPPDFPEERAKWHEAE